MWLLLEAFALVDAQNVLWGFISFFFLPVPEGLYVLISSELFKLLPGRLDHYYKSTRYCDHQPTSNLHHFPASLLLLQRTQTCVHYSESSTWHAVLTKGLRNVLKGYSSMRNPICCLGAGYFPWLVLKNIGHSGQAGLGLISPFPLLNSHELICSIQLALLSTLPSDLYCQFNLISHPWLLHGKPQSVPVPSLLFIFFRLFKSIIILFSHLQISIYPSFWFSEFLVSPSMTN